MSQYLAGEYAAKHGLVTVEDHIHHCQRLAENFGKLWTRERLIEHWHKVAANPRCHLAGEVAAKALANLHAKEREPGEDESEVAVR
jgi:hypothetical protein